MLSGEESGGRAIEGEAGECCSGLSDSDGSHGNGH